MKKCDTKKCDILKCRKKKCRIFLIFFNGFPCKKTNQYAHQSDQEVNGFPALLVGVRALQQNAKKERTPPVNV